MEKVEIRISREGEVRVTASGVAGAGCQQLTAPFEAAIGVVVSDEPTAEMYQETVVETAQEA